MAEAVVSEKMSKSVEGKEEKKIVTQTFSDFKGNSEFTVGQNNVLSLAPNLIDANGKKTGWWVEFLPVGTQADLDRDKTLYEKRVAGTEDENDEEESELYDHASSTAVCAKIEEESGEGFAAESFVYYEKGRYENGERVGTWRKCALFRKAIELFEYTVPGEKTGPRLQYECDCYATPYLGVFGAYKKGLKDGPEYCSFTQVSKDDKGETDFFSDLTDMIAPLRGEKTKLQKCEEAKRPIVNINGTDYYTSDVTNYRAGKVVGAGLPELVDGAEGQFDENGKKHGFWKDRTGEGEYVHGVKQGKWKCIMNRFHFGDKNDKPPTFNAISSYDDNKFTKDSFVTFVDGVLNGPSKQENEEGSYENGKKIGTWIETPFLWGRDKNRDLKTTGDYKEGKKTGVWRDLDWGSGNGMGVGEYKEGKLDGKWEYDGASLTYVDGVLNGPAVHKENGRKVSEGDYKNGKKTGVWTFYDKNSKIDKVTKRGEYVDDVLHGKWFFYTYGDTVVNGQYENGVPSGKWTNSKELYTIRCNEKPAFENEMTIWEKEPKVMDDVNPNTLEKRKALVESKKMECKINEAGQFDGPFKYGSKIHPDIVGTFSNGVRTGKWTSYYSFMDPVGKYEEGEYVNDVRKGPWTKYYLHEKNKPELTGVYRAGKRVGVWVDHIHNVERIYPDA